jgi:hypothetical protein
MIPLKMPQMQGAEISSKVKAQRAIVINPFQLSASGFQLLCNTTDGVFSAKSTPKKIKPAILAGFLILSNEPQFYVAASSSLIVTATL